MRARLLHSALLPPVRAVLSSRHKARWIAATAIVAAAGTATPLVVGATAASAELGAASSSADVVQVALSAPATVTRGTPTTLSAFVTAADVGLPERTVQFVFRAPGASVWQVLGSASTGVDGVATFPVRTVGSATEYGAYYSDVAGVVQTPTSTTVVHVIDLKPAVPRVVVYRAPVRIAGHLVKDGSHALASQRVAVKFRPRAGAAWSSTRWVTTNAAGLAWTSGRFTKTFQVGIQFPGAAGLAPSPFVVKTVIVRPKPATARNGFRFPFLNARQVESPGSWTFDQGIDMFAQGDACGAAAKLVAVGDGTVIQTGISGFGPTAPVIRMSNGPFRGRNVYYGHTGRIYVHVGQHVHAGQLVAQIGCGRVGMSSAPHLEIGVGVPGGPPCCPGFGQTSHAMYRQLLAALRNS